MRLFSKITAVFTAMISAACSSHETFDPEHVMWYDSPAAAWEETLPLGNGRLGMMPYGGTSEERIVLNEISMWSGSEVDYSNPDAAESLKEIRQLLIEGKNAEAQAVMYRRFVPKKQTDGGTYGSYQTLGDLNISYDISGEPEAYRRELDLRTATATSAFNIGDTCHFRKCYVTGDDDVMVVEIGSSHKGAVSFEARLSRNERVAYENVGDGIFKMSGELDSCSDAEGVRYAAYAGIVAEGKDAKITGNKVADADKAWIVVSAATSFLEGEDYDKNARRTLEEVLDGFNGKKLYSRHLNHHRSLYDRAQVSLEGTTESSAYPTDRRLQAYAEGAKDNDLAALYYNYGRYLLISSTREGTLPPNLQGLWADTYQTPWNGDYHTNINVQMNHWIAEPGNLSELHLPLTDLIMNLIPSGEKSAKDFYGPDAEGWVLHMMTNIWNYTAPGEHPSWGATNTGAAWLCAHLWEHYIYTMDKEYLERVYPALEGAARFFLSTMIREPENGYLVTGPTSSPENAFYIKTADGGKTAVSICMGPTMDNQLVRELFTNTIEAAEILGKTGTFSDSLKKAVEELAPHKISKEGYLMEWLTDYEEVEIHHRHVSHLYGLHPGNQISPVKTPELAEACKVTLNRRGDEATGWSRAWKLNFWARLGDGNRALKLLKSLLHPAWEDGRAWHVSGTYQNLFCSHPPFQIDGNFGGAAGISEMLVQSHEGFVNLLPALPDEWSEGELKGFKVRGGAEIDMKWKDGRPTEIEIRQPSDASLTLKVGEDYITVKGNYRTKI